MPGQLRVVSERHPAGPTGVTLIELLVVTVMIAVLSGAAISLLTAGHRDTAAQEAARRVAADIAYAQADAIAHRATRQVVFDPATEKYTVTDGGSAITHPLTKVEFVVSLVRVFHGSGIDLESADFGGTQTLTFGSDGTPSPGGTVTVSAGGHSYAVDVADGTGRITITG